MKWTHRNSRMASLAVGITISAYTRVGFAATSIRHPESPTARIQLSRDLPLIWILEKACYWQSLLDTGAANTVSELAREIKLESGRVAEELCLTRLAPGHRGCHPQGSPVAAPQSAGASGTAGEGAGGGVNGNPAGLALCQNYRGQRRCRPRCHNHRSVSFASISPAITPPTNWSP